MYSSVLRWCKVETVEEEDELVEVEMEEEELCEKLCELEEEEED